MQAKHAMRRLGTMRHVAAGRMRERGGVQSSGTPGRYKLCHVKWRGAGLKSAPAALLRPSGDIATVGEDDDAM